MLGLFRSFMDCYALLRGLTLALVIAHVVRYLQRKNAFHKPLPHVGFLAVSSL